MTLSLEDEAGIVLHRNFTTFLVSDGPAPRQETIQRDGGQVRLLRFAPGSFTAAQWSLKQWNVLDGLKVNGAGHGYFEYRMAGRKASTQQRSKARRWSSKHRPSSCSAKTGKGAAKQEGDFMLGKGTHDPSRNPNAYPMTDTVRFPTAVRVRVAGQSAGQFDLPDDPADHRGILSWHAQKRDRKLREAGSYGYLVQADDPAQRRARGGRGQGDRRSPRGGRLAARRPGPLRRTLRPLSARPDDRVVRETLTTAGIGGRTSCGLALGRAYRIRFWPSRLVPCGWTHHQPKLNFVSLTPFRASVPS